MYLYGPLPLPPCGFISFRVVSNCGCSTTSCCSRLCISMVPSLFHPAGSLASVWSPIVAAPPHHFKGAVGEGGPKYKTTNRTDFPAYMYLFNSQKCIARYALSQVIYRIQSEIYLETLASIWNVSVHLTEIRALMIMLSWNGQFVHYRNMPINSNCKY